MMNKTISTEFIANLMSQLSDKENEVISPYGIAAVLSMAAEGAGGNTLDEILSCLGFETLDELRLAVVDAIANPCNAFTSENSITLQKGNGSVELCEQFRNILTDKYAASISEKESGGDAAVELCNVASFKAEWLVKMERDLTGKKCFHNADGSSCNPVFLSCTEDLRYYRDDEFWTTVQAVALPYKMNGISVPYELVLVDSEKPLTAAVIQEMLSNMRIDKCDVEFPEFSIKSVFNLIPMMETLGVKDIFNEEHSVLDRIATDTLYAAAFSQEAEIQVDKAGTIAKARTCMTLCLKGGISHSDEFIFNKPFRYFLRNTNTGEILFMGKVNQLADCKRQSYSIDISRWH